MPEEIAQSFEVIARRLLRGKVLPLLGAGANLGERPPDAHFQRGMYLPSGAELAAELAVNYPVINGHDLAQVSQYIAAQEGEGALERLHRVASGLLVAKLRVEDARLLQIG